MNLHIMNQIVLMGIGKIYIDEGTPNSNPQNEAVQISQNVTVVEQKVTKT